MATSNCLITNVPQNIFFCVQQLKEIHSGLVAEYRVTKCSFLGELSL